MLIRGARGFYDRSAAESKGSKVQALDQYCFVDTNLKAYPAYDLSSGKLTVPQLRITAEQQTGKPDQGNAPKDRDLELKGTAPEGIGNSSSGSPRVRAKAPPLRLQLSEAKLGRSLPLKSQAVLRLPLMLHSSEVQTGRCNMQNCFAFTSACCIKAMLIC